jgi:hypothetical protein
MKSLRSIAWHAVAALAIAIVAFLAASGVMLLILWELVYGDTYGGRWQKLAWPYGAMVAIVAVTLYVMGVAGRIRLGLPHNAATLAILALAALAWVLIATNFLMPLPIPR